MSDDEGQDELVTEEMLWDRIPEVHGEERANTYYELSARIFARGQYDEALALAETARDIFSELGASAPSEGLAQAYSAIGYNLNQLKRMDEAATAMSKAVSILRENKSPIALELACTLGEWWYASKNYEKVIETMYECSQEHLVDGNNIGAANDMHLIGCAQRELKNYSEAVICFQEARKMFKLEKEIIHVARCDQKIASCYNELKEGEKAFEAAQKSIDVFETAHDHRRETFALFELGKAEILLGKLEDGLSTLDGVLQIVAEDEPKDFEFILDIEDRMVAVMRQLGRMEEADEVERRLKSVREALADDPETDAIVTLND
ncbi:Tetratricopeptide repeat-containing protein [Candidatus Planktophila sulfonica]|uniref:Tetratricopeptide repeat-containing protein n=1 Tax=Candidatus Planktophila sulfonica TaxID=1884904 RepID=A0A249KI36_9ACTN|nr:tetratricopeptide repeat protein [Candidatus Planktophila sulfonica]ASY16462.1 Tetratricopeptide repeat-containing protein [Candidatus Planktophila sulfonica]